MRPLDRIRVRGSALSLTCPALKKVREGWIALLEVPAFTEGVVLSVTSDPNVAVVRLEGYDSPLKMYTLDLEVLTAASYTYSTTMLLDLTR